MSSGDNKNKQSKKTQDKDDVLDADQSSTVDDGGKFDPTQKSKKGKAISGDWYSDRYGAVLAQRNVMILFVCALLMAVAILSVSVVYISSSRTIEPFVIEVEKQTGITTLVDPSQVRQYTADTAVNNYFLINYIKYRELFDSNNYQYNWYTAVRLFSEDRVFREFLGVIRTDNPKSPQNLYRGLDGLSLKIRSIQYLANDSVQIRFSIEGKDTGVGSSNKLSINNKIVLISFRYVSMKMDEKQRFVNPLGFQVTSYRVSDEFVQ